MKIDIIKEHLIHFEGEKWEHIWVCSKNSQDASEYLIFKESVNEVVDKELVEMEKEDIIKFKKSVFEATKEAIIKFKKNVFEATAIKSLTLQTENLLHEVTRGLINEKWWRTCKLKGEKSALLKIFDTYMKNLQYKLWNKRCEETIELEKQMGILKDLKGKKKNR
ncbi:hypothetical protein C1646_766318 [Rhizophagus diaphanus]|nr:hypothetical protein C1646_766318 [Rhizophagus diaphanus] [Rhizophagus sp. MUCL 43196]